MKPELVVVVDNNDKVLKTVDRASAAKSDIIRVTGVFITNEKNEIMLQLRSAKRDSYPLHWDCSAGGHTDPGEDYVACAHRELYEETGIKTKLVFLGKHYIELDDKRKHFISFFKGKYDGEFKINPKEVSKLNFFSNEQISKMIHNKEKFHPECLFGLRKYFFNRD
jgi:isopentenyldiphosphate isomerase